MLLPRNKQPWAKVIIFAGSVDFTDFFAPRAVKRVLISLSEAGHRRGAAEMIVVLTQIFTKLGGFPHYFCVYLCHVCDNLCFLLRRWVSNQKG